MNQIPTVLVKQKPAATPINVNVPVPVKVPVPMKVPVKAPIIVRPIAVTKPQTPYEVNKLFNEMKNSKKPFMTIKMKAPAKQSMFPDPFSLFDDDNRYCFSVFVLGCCVLPSPLLLLLLRLIFTFNLCRVHMAYFNKKSKCITNSTHPPPYAQHSNACDLTIYWFYSSLK